MGNFKNELKGFESIPRDVVFDESLSDRARFVFIYMACKPADWDFFIDPMSKELGYSAETLRKYINELVESGWLVKGEQKNEKGVFGATEYTLKANNVDRHINLPTRKNTVTENFRDGKSPTQRNIYNNTNLDNKEEEIDKSISKKNNKNLDLSFVDYLFMPIIQEWLAYKKEKRQTYTQTGAKQLYKKLLQLSDNNVITARKIIEQSMANNYSGIFPLRNTANPASQSLPQGMILQGDRDSIIENSKKDLW